MRLEIVSLETEINGGKLAPGLLSWKLNDILLSSSAAAAVVLPAPLDADRPLLEFLAEWTVRFSTANKQIFVVAEDADRASALAASHPDIALNRAGSLAELRRTRPSLFDSEPDAGSRAEALAVGARVAASGEYVCTACDKSRMWLKGDAAAACDNLQCPDAHAGWRLTFELF